MYSSTFTGEMTRHERAHSLSQSISMSASDASWMDTVLARLGELRKLPYGWDGYRGVAVSRANAHFTAQLLGQICGADTPPPSIVPGSDGDLQIEWHTSHGDLELHVVRPYEVRAFASFTGYDNDVELPLTRDFSAVAQWVLAITEGAGAVSAAA